MMDGVDSNSSVYDLTFSFDLLLVVVVVVILCCCIQRGDLYWQITQLNSLSWFGSLIYPGNTGHEAGIHPE